MTTSAAAAANENALPKIDHFHPSDVHFYFRPGDTMPSITPGFSDPHSLRKVLVQSRGRCDSMVSLSC